MELKLRPYQQDGALAVKSEYDSGVKRTLVTWPTGCGKTWLFVFIAYTVLVHGGRVLVIVNTYELVRQTAEKFAKIGVPVGVVKQRLNEWDHHTVVASIQTLCRPDRLAQIPWDHFSLIVVDEAHLANAPSYQRVFRYFDKAHFLGVSATLFRGDGESLALAGWESIAHVYTINEAIADKALVPPVVFRIQTNTNLDGVRARKDSRGIIDFNEDDLADAINNQERNDSIVENWIELAENRRTVAFCVDVQHAFDLANSFRRVGVDARVIWGEMDPSSREATLLSHRNGEFSVICNCGVLTHGYDDEGIRCVVMARPTKSKTLAVQCIGRGLRPDEANGKQDCYILDFVDVSMKHQLVTSSEILQLQSEMLRIAPGRLDRPKSDDEPILTDPEEVPVPSPEIDLAERERLIFERAQKSKMLREARLASPASLRSRKSALIKLMRQFGWSADAARAIVTQKEITLGELQKVLSDVKSGRIREQDVQLAYTERKE